MDWDPPCPGRSLGRGPWQGPEERCRRRGYCERFPRGQARRRRVSSRSRSRGVLRGRDDRRIWALATRDSGLAPLSLIHSLTLLCSHSSSPPSFPQSPTRTGDGRARGSGLGPYAQLLFDVVVCPRSPSSAGLRVRIRITHRHRARVRAESVSRGSCDCLLRTFQTSGFPSHSSSARRSRHFTEFDPRTRRSHSSGSGSSFLHAPVLLRPSPPLPFVPQASLPSPPLPCPHPCTVHHSALRSRAGGLCEHRSQCAGARGPCAMSESVEFSSCASGRRRLQFLAGRAMT